MPVMLEKQLDQIEFADIDAFVQAGWPEGKTVEYKRETYGSTDADKKELLKDVSSFANTQGGDIYIGIEENNGVPVGIPGISVPNVDSEKLRLEEIIRNGIEPRIDLSVHAVETPTSTTVLILRINESLLTPHRVVFKGKFGEFWGRSSAGKFSMDTDELRRAFTLSDSIYEQIRSFRQNRVMQVLREDTPVPMLTGAKLILHIVPVSSFRSRQLIDVSSMHDLSTKFAPIAASGWDHRLNLDGHVTYAGRSDEGGCHSYTQFFRNGIVEAVLSDIVRVAEGGAKIMQARYYEHHLTQRHRTIDQFMKGLRELEIEPPIWCFLSFVGVKGARIPTEGYFPDERRDIDRDVLLLPESNIDNLEVSGARILRPLFDLVWNASGYARSPNFDADSNWIGR
jgi:hypothetical protein